METLKLTAAVLSLGLLVAPAYAQDVGAGAQGQCAPRDRLVEALGETFGESTRGLGLSDTGNGNVIEVWTSAEGSWSLVVNRPEGTSCLADFGQGWALVPQGEPA